MPITNISIQGYVVGPIWWPVGAECYKPLDYNATSQNALWSDPGTLRDHVLCATNDGDFQNCTIAHGRLVIERWQGERRVIREFPLSHFPSVADCLHPEGDDWCPQNDGEE